MKAVTPYEIAIDTTNVAVNSEAEWADDVNYDVGDLIQVTSVTPHKVYESLRGNNLNRFPADWLEPQEETTTSSSSETVSTGAKTLTVPTGLGFSAGQVIKLSKTTTPKTVNMTAEVTDYVTGTGSLSISVYSVTGSGTHSNWTIEVEDEIGFWKEIGATNQWFMFDEYVNTQTERADSIDVKIPVSRADYVAFFNVDASEVELELWDETETELLWSSSINLAYNSSVITQITDWTEYFFGEHLPSTDATFFMGIASFSAILRIIISTVEPGGIVKCGNVVVGRSYDLGSTQFGASSGMQDFSKKTTDEDGKTKVTEGYWSKRASWNLWVDNIKLDSVYKVLVSLRGTPTAWVGNNEGETSFESMVIFGLFRDFNIVVEGPSHSWCSLEIEGLI